MSRIAYVDGRYVPHAGAAVHIEDRGYQFADGVYEVVAVRGGAFLDEAPHLDRLDRSLAALGITAPMKRAPLRLAMRELVRRNRVRNGMLYLQVTRGQMARDHVVPGPIAPVLVMTVRRAVSPDPRLWEEGVAVLTRDDIRWKRCDIKSISLLPNVLLKQGVRQAGAFEAWLVAPDGTVTEGTSTNAWIIDGEPGVLITHPADNAILDGVTRRAILREATAAGIAVEQRPFTLEEALSAREAFLTSTTLQIVPVVRIDAQPIGTGQPGPITRQLMERYAAHVAANERKC